VSKWATARTFEEVSGALGRAAAAALLASVVVLPLPASAQAVWPVAAPPSSMESPSGPPRYAPSPHLDASAKAPEGWGLFAVASGRSMNLSATRSWADDPNALPGEIEVGYGWRRRNWSAVVGYAQPDSAVQPSYPVMADHAKDLNPHGLVGLSIAFRYH
jgi:hypothetical protein